jgi:CubicO group peptidase (beta-lactamase class C family)
LRKRARKFVWRNLDDLYGDQRLCWINPEISAPGAAQVKLPTDPGIWVPPEKVARLVDPPVGAEIPLDRDVTKPSTLFLWGGGLASTAADDLRFCQMLLNGGELDEVRILSPATVRRMTTNALAARHPLRRWRRPPWGHWAARSLADLKLPRPQIQARLRA